MLHYNRELVPNSFDCQEPKRIRYPALEEAFRNVLKVSDDLNLDFFYKIEYVNISPKNTLSGVYTVNYEILLDLLRIKVVTEVPDIPYQRIMLYEEWFHSETKIHSNYENYKEIVYLQNKRAEVDHFSKYKRVNENLWFVLLGGQERISIEFQADSPEQLQEYIERYLKQHFRLHG